VVEFIRAVHPCLGQAFQNRMRGVAMNDDKGMDAAVARAIARLFDFLAGLDFHRLVGLRIHHDAFAELRRAPGQPEHAIEVRPTGEGVVGGVDIEDTAAVFDVGDEGVFDRLGPVGAVVVIDHDRVFRKLGAPCFPFRLLRFLVGALASGPFGLFLHDLGFWASVMSLVSRGRSTS